MPSQTRAVPPARKVSTAGSASPPPRDRATLRLAAFVGGLVLALVAGFGIGRAVTTGESPTANGPMGGMGTGSGDGHTHAPGTPDDHLHGGASSGDAAVSGLAVSSGGYTLVPSATAFKAGTAARLTFRIEGPDRKPVTNFAAVHDKQMHLIVVRRDLSGYQHLHPTMAADGTWSINLTLPVPGLWRAYTDFAAVDASGAQLPIKLGVDLTVAGAYAARALPGPARESTVDGMTVTYEGTAQVGATQPLVFRVYRSGTPVTDLERYLGAYGHLVVLREGDLGYVHVHAEDQLAGGGAKFWLAAPSPGTYRLFFDFQHGGKVRTAEYTMTVP